jgi:hypothetical protein
MWSKWMCRLAHTTRHNGTCLLHDWTIKVLHKNGTKPIQKYSHCKKLRKNLWLIYELLIMRETQEKIIFYARFCHMHDVKKLRCWRFLSLWWSAHYSLHLHTYSVIVTLHSYQLNASWSYSLFRPLVDYILHWLSEI